jgi:hypothetical protein
MARKRRPPGLQALQIISPLRRTIIPEAVPPIYPARPFRAGCPRSLAFGDLGNYAFVRKLPVVAETSRNSFARNILQGTSLFSIFCSATLLVTSRKQGFCAQSMGGGTRCSSFVVISRPTVNDASLRLCVGRPRARVRGPEKRHLLLGVVMSDFCSLGWRFCFWELG